MRAQGRLITPEEFGEIILRANPDGSNLRLKDVARIELGAQTYNLTGRYNGKPCGDFGVLSAPRLERRGCRETPSRQRIARAEQALPAGS